VPEGPYAEVDIGAGTCHATFFSILSAFRGQRWLKERLCFYATRSEPIGMDAVDAALARIKRIPHGQCLSLRGQERTEISRVGTATIEGVLKGIRENYVLAWRPAYKKLSWAEVDRFKTHDVFVIGGGSLVPQIAELFTAHPGGHDHDLRLRFLGVPSDLFRTDGKPIGREDMPFLAVAYGLTFDAAEIPETLTPDEVSPGPRKTQPPSNWEEM
jgi:hypothetical protein